MKFSIIVPVYNVEKYLSKCLDSLISQTYKDFEIIIVNDGSTDGSQLIIDNYRNAYPNLIKAYIKGNGGLSDTRNFGIKKATGDFLIFVDSDDYISASLLEKLVDTINVHGLVDVIGFSLANVNENNVITGTVQKPEFYNLSGEQALVKLINSKKYFEAACYYAYNRNFWEENKFEYPVGTYHEDFGLTPLVLAKASKVTCINFIGYYYYQTQNSITRNNNLQLEKQKANDLLKHFDNINTQIKNLNISNETITLLNSYMANALLYRLDNLDKTLKKDYKKALKERKITDFLIATTLKQRIKKSLIKLKINLV